MKCLLLYAASVYDNKKKHTYIRHLKSITWNVQKHYLEFLHE